MSRFLVLVALSFSFCCAPAATQEQPLTKDDASRAITARVAEQPAAPAPREARARMASDDVGRSEGKASAGPMAQPKAEARPGLGTSWGETRSSSVNEVPFERDGTSPVFTAALHYNDASGARVMSQREGAALGSAAIVLGNAITVSLRNEWGSVLPAYRTGHGSVAVGENGQRYSIAVQNHTNERFEVVLSVDGLDVLDGRDAGYAKRGYLIDAFATVEIEGFRQSADAVAAFRFGSVQDSYAALTGSARNVGVIGAAVFGERGYLARLRTYRGRLAAEQHALQSEAIRRHTADPFPSKWASPPLYQAR